MSGSDEVSFIATKPSQMEREGRSRRLSPSPRVILRGHTAPVSSLTFLPSARESSRHLLTGDENGNVRLWDTSFEETLLIHPFPKDIERSPVQCIASHPASPTNVLIQYKSGYIERLNLSCNPFAVDYEAWTASSERMQIRDVKPLAEEHRLDGAAIADSFCRIMYLDGNTWVGPSGDGNAIVVHDDRFKPTLACRIRPDKNLRFGMLMALSGAGDKCLLGGYENGSVAVWDVRQANKITRQIRVANETVLTVCSSPFGRSAIVGGAFSCVAAVSDVVGTLEVTAAAELPAEGVSDIAWRKDGKLIATAGWDGMVRIWNGRRSEESLLRKKGGFRWHDGSVQCVGYSEDGKLLASGGKDGTVALWDGI